jgi:hypothetical protein
LQDSDNTLSFDETGKHAGDNERQRSSVSQIEVAEMAAIRCDEILHDGWTNASIELISQILQ